MLEDLSYLATFLLGLAVGWTVCAVCVGVMAAVLAYRYSKE